MAPCEWRKISKWLGLVDKEILSTNYKATSGKVRDKKSFLLHFWKGIRAVGEGRCKFKKWWDFRERSFTFSLGFPAIGPTVSDEVRRKVAPHSKGYAGVPVLGSFEKLWKVGVFLLLVLLFG